MDGIDYIDQYRQLHTIQPRYGRGSARLLVALRLLAQDAGARSILDYGAGKSHTADEIARRIGGTGYRYDPAIAEIASLPSQPIDFVVSTDVMEHVPEDGVRPLFQHVRSITSRAAFSISTRLAKTILPNGMNAHCTVRPAEWWLAQLSAEFPDAQLLSHDRQQCMLATWKPALPTRLLVKLSLRSSIARKVLG